MADNPSARENGHVPTLALDPRALLWVTVAVLPSQSWWHTPSTREAESGGAVQGQPWLHGYIGSLTSSTRMAIL